MPISDRPRSLDPYSRSKVELWRIAADELAQTPLGFDPLVQAGIHLVVAWLRNDAGDAASLLSFFGRPHGPLASQLQLVGSVLGGPRPEQWSQLPPLWWKVVKTAYHLRWLELTLDVVDER
jgi:hypothetical protein